MTKAKMTAAIRTAIKENLEEEASGVLLQLIEEGKETARELKALKIDYENLEEEKEVVRTHNDALRENIESLHEEIRQHETLEEREKAVTKREIVQELTEANSRAWAAEQKAEAIHDLVGNLFRNTKFKKTITDTKTVPVVVKDYEGAPERVEHHNSEETHEETTVAE